VKWSSKTEKISDTEFNLVISGKIDNGWHVYSQFTPDGGPLSMVLTFINSKGNYELVGKAVESPYKKQFNDVFGVDEYYFEKNVTVTQKVKITNPKTDKIKLSVDYQVCKESCINDKKEFVFDIPVLKEPENVVAPINTDTAKPQDIVPVKAVDLKKKELKNNENKVAEPVKEKSGWSLFVFAFLGGILATITPCVFPMIPMTVSFFLKQSGKKSKGMFNAVFYGLCIVAICVLITIPFHLLEGIN
jgi:thiol:disulfide interchange protein